MLDPITATMAAGAGSRLVDTVTNVAQALTKKIAGPASLSASEEVAPFDAFDQTARVQGKDLLKRLFAAFPGLKTQLGEGPYWISTNKEGTVQISSQKTGNKITVDGSTKIGAEFIKYYQDMAALAVKKPQKGLEFPIV